MVRAVLVLNHEPKPKIFTLPSVGLAPDRRGATRKLARKRLKTQSGPSNAISKGSHMMMVIVVDTRIALAILLVLELVLT
jgi:hypothetical protein